MKLPSQPGLFGLEKRMDKLSEMGDPLVELEALIDWEAFSSVLSVIRMKERKSKAGAKPFDAVLMFKILVLQQLHNLSDDGIEYQVRDRLSFMRFLGLQLESRVPDAKTVWLFREHLKNHQLVELLFASFHEQLKARGFVARQGQMIDATFIEAPRQRNSREENATIKAGNIPAEWKLEENADKLAQKDTDARWAKKNNETHYGYKDHVNVDEAYKLIQDYAVTEASLHDSNVFEQLLDHGVDEQGKKRPAYADSAYRSAQREQELVNVSIESHIHEKGVKGAPLNDTQKESNRIKSRTRVRVEHVFAAQAARGGHLVRTIGLARAKIKVGMMNLVYNMTRLGQLLRRNAQAAIKYVLVCYALDSHRQVMSNIA